MTKRWPAVWAVLALTLGLESEARAEVAVVGLEYRAPAECSERSAFVSALEARTDRVRTAASGAHGTLFVELATTPATVHGSILFREASGRETERVVTGPTCGDVVQALALIASVLVDPMAHDAPLDANGASATESPPAAAVEADTAAAALGSGEQEPDRVQAKAAGQPEQPAQAAERSVTEAPAVAGDPSDSAGLRWRVGAGAGAGLHGGVAPAATLGVSLEVTLERRLPRSFGLAIGLTLQHLQSDTVTTTAGDAEFVWTAGRAWICPVRWPAHGLASVAACGALEGGLHSGSGFNTLDRASQQSFWLAPGLFGRAEVRPLPFVALVLDVGAVAPLFRPLYYFDTGVEAFEAPLMAGFVTAGVRLQAE